MQTAAIEDLEQLVASRTVGLAHLSHHLLRAGHSGQGRHLSRGVNARDYWLLHPGEESGHVGWSYQIPTRQPVMA